MTVVAESPSDAPIQARTALGVITGWSAVSAFGIGTAAASAGLRSTDRPESLSCEVDDWTAIVVPDFDIRAELGSKGTRSLDRLTGLTVTAVRELLGDLGGRDEIGGCDDIALVLGTDTGSTKSMMDFTRDSLVGEKPYHVDPSRFPNAVMNCAAGRSAIWYSLRGPNATVSSGRVAGLSALQYSSRILRGGQAEAVICGAAEEYTVNRAWLERLIRGPRPEPVTLGEGCALFLLEKTAGPGRTPLATLLSTSFRVCAPGMGVDPVQLMTSCIASALRDAGVRPEQVGIMAGAGDVDGIESAALARAGLSSAAAIDVSDRIGDTGAACTSFALASVLVTVRDSPGTIAVVTAYDRDGAMGCAVLRVGEAEQ
ncbi:beta-ketoacyl synthase N-terminal-like domain-containing protein [Nocardia sp. NPDC127579]|uniref:beta-ketoacyl synthase N-terminal-like domain-containing protein n=1 Tax=Nocardia sp. NPDC127579 TaxID=3345402 RepID=UPI003643DB8F